MAYSRAGNVTQAEAHLRQRRPGEIRPPNPLMEAMDAMLESAVAFQEVRGAHALDEGQWAAAADYFRKGIELAPTSHRIDTSSAPHWQ